LASPNNASPAADETAAFAERWAPGQVLVGKYVVEHVVGAGAMAIVVSALHKQLDTRVAIKFLRPEMLSKSDLVSRFRREGRAAAKIRSKHVARVFDVGELEDGTPFIVMEYLEGHNLAQVLEERGPMPVGETIGYALQVCEALAGAHALGIVHRDIKPANIFLHSDGEADCVKLLDFGISKAVPGAGGNDLSLTQTVSLMGSPLYMSPEQLRETRIADARSDIWALGVVVYELLTGEVAFNAESITKLTATILEGSPKPICAFRPDVPAELESVIHRCLAKDMALRYQAVTDLARDLMPFASDDARGAAERSPLLRSPTGVPLPAGGAPLRSPLPPASGQVSKGGGVVVATSYESASRISLSPTLPSSAATTPARSTFSRSVPAGEAAEGGDAAEGGERRPEPPLASKAPAAPWGRFVALGLGALVVLGGGYTVWSLTRQSTTAHPAPAPDASAPFATSGAPGGAAPPSTVGAPVASAPSGAMGASVGGSAPAPLASGAGARARLTAPPRGPRPPGRPPTAPSQRPPSASPGEGEPDIGY
jgi:eukaryotic-like serine/threonine-protein kinase